MQHAFDSFRKVFRLLCYGNLTSALRKILQGDREEVVWLVVF